MRPIKAWNAKHKDNNKVEKQQRTAIYFKKLANIEQGGLYKPPYGKPDNIAGHTPATISIIESFLRYLRATSCNSPAVTERTVSR